MLYTGMRDDKTMGKIIFNDAMPMLITEKLKDKDNA